MEAPCFMLRRQLVFWLLLLPLYVLVVAALGAASGGLLLLGGVALAVPLWGDMRDWRRGVKVKGTWFPSPPLTQNQLLAEQNAILRKRA